MFIETEETPNPNSLKFLPHRTLLKPRQVRSYISDSDSCDSPLAESLFTLDGIEGVFIANDFISVTKSELSSWSDLRPLVLGELMNFFATEQPVVLGEEVDDFDTGNNEYETIGFEEKDTELVNQVKSLLEERVQPVVAQDGGDIRFTGFRDGIVYLLLRGACAGCPSSTLTLHDGIENMLKYYIPEVKEVRSAADI